ncbi:MAG: tyrosine phosphatase family protein [Beijerinckiaceae bacterium]
MPRIHVCSLAALPAAVAETGAQSIVTLLREGVDIDRPAHIPAERHLHLGLSDIIEAEDGFALPQAAHVEALIAFARAWDRQAPLLIHCYAGVSRSTAAAFIATCALKPEVSEIDIARLIRERSPTATPNALLVQLGDASLAREGRMVEAVRTIGRGRDCFEGVPFHIDIR